MATKTIVLGTDVDLNLILGQQDENKVEAVAFDFSAWKTAFGSGALSLAVQRSVDKWPYAVTMTTSGDVATWTISDADTEYEGLGHFQLTYTVGTIVKKSVVYKFTVYESLGATGSVLTPQEIETFVNEVTETVEGLEAMIGNSLPVDTTLSVSGKAADAKKVGDEVSDLKENLTNNLPGKSSANLFNPTSVVLGHFVKGTDGSAVIIGDNSSYAYYILSNIEAGKYTVSGTNYNYYLLNNSDVIVSHGGNTSDKSNYTIEIIDAEINAGASKLAISFIPESHPVETFMIVKGEELPSSYEPFNYYLFNEKAVKAIREEINNNGNVYHVGRGIVSDIDFTDPISCFYAIQDIPDKKTVHIYEGEYDIYDLLGGDDYFDLINPSTQSYYDVQPWLDNIEIIGHGKVVLSLYVPNTYSQDIRWMFSVLNIRGNCYLENLTLEANSCRYCIHDESSVNYPNTRHVYKNINCTYYGTSQAVGCGYSVDSTVLIEDCIFNSTNLWAYSMHTRGGVDITCKNSVFISGSSGYEPVRLSQETNKELQVKIENCFFKSNTQYEINIRPETQYTTTPINKTKIDIIGCNVSAINNEYTVNNEKSIKYDIETGNIVTLVDVSGS